MPDAIAGAVAGAIDTVPPPLTDQAGDRLTADPRDMPQRKRGGRGPLESRGSGL